VTGIERLLEIMARLRDPEGGCPWDLEQGFESIAPYTIEEAYEVADAVERGDLGALRGELGDLLFQVVYHAQLAREVGRFGFADVVADACEKLVRRHPHVFGDARIETAAAQTRAWEEHKAAEREAEADRRGERPGALASVPLGLPALARAAKLQGRSARVGFTWGGAPDYWRKLDEELGELREVHAAGGPPERLREELGDVLFVVVGLARALGVDAEEALRAANRKFETRFRHVEQALTAGGRRIEDTSASELWKLWEEAKQKEKAG
jgi:ATP diphosphatase